MRRRWPIPRGILQHAPEANHFNFLGHVMSVVDAEDIHRFFHDFHRTLARQGVDGVKVDCQAVLEGVAYGHGGGWR